VSTVILRWAALVSTCGAVAALAATSREGGSGDRADLAVALSAVLLIGIALLVLRRLRREEPRAESIEPVPDAAAAAAPRRYTDLTLYSRLLREARPYWGHIATLFVVGLLATPIALLTPVPLKIAIDAITGSDAIPAALDPLIPASFAASASAVLLVAAGLLVAVALLNQLQKLVNSVLGTYTGEKLLLRFRARLLRHVQRLSFSYHDSQGTADSVYRIQYDAASIQWVAIYGVTPFVSAALTLVGMIYITGRIDWQLAVVALTVAPVLFIITWLYRRRLRARWREAKQLESSALSVVQEVLTGLRVVKAFGQEDREHDRFLGHAGESTRARIRIMFVESSYGLMTGLTIAVGTGFVLYIGARHVEAGTLTAGELTLVLGYLVQLYLPLEQINKSIVTLQSSLASAERAFSLLDHEHDVPDRPDALPLRQARGDVELRHLSFSYDGGTDVLSEVSLTVPAGTRVGISGSTGAGKTTLVSLLTRFYDPTAGAILLDGVDLRDYRVADLRNQFAIVLQEPVLFSTSIAENIAYARPEASREEIEAAAHAANAHDFIVALPDGYDTLVGERGMRLSGGERQRISLARAFLKDAPILILDEPTSSVDVKTEAGIMDAMERLMAGRTTFMIAHRLGTLEHCDARLTISDGRVAGADDEGVDETRRVYSLVRAGTNGASSDAARGEGLVNDAVRAWTELTGNACTAQVLEKGKESSVCRLREASGRTVIAKRCTAEVATREGLIYEHVLPRVPLPSLLVYGLVEADGGLRWIFVEDGCRLKYSGTNRVHRNAGLRWLSALHGAEVPSLMQSALPDRGVAHYRRHLDSAENALRAAASYSHLDASGKAIVEDALRSCELMEGAWPSVEAVCAHSPSTLVHGDFVPKNLRLRRTPADDIEVLALEWKTAGLGPPEVDLARYGAEELFRYAGSNGSGSHGVLGRRAAAGAVLRYAAAFDWAASSLPYPEAGDALAELGSYQRPVRQAVDEVRSS
jgi:ATP-binding cassette, subfamily B, bacterial